MIVLLDKFDGANDANAANHTPLVGGPYSIGAGNVAISGNQLVFVDAASESSIGVLIPDLGNLALSILEVGFELANVSGSQLKVQLIKEGTAEKVESTIVEDFLAIALQGSANFSLVNRVLDCGLGHHTLKFNCSRDRSIVALDTQEVVLSGSVDLSIVNEVHFLGSGDAANAVRLDYVRVEGQTGV